MIVRAAAIAVLLSLGTTAAPTAAQGRQRVVEVFGNDTCPAGVGGEIVVCARKPESDRFRIPTEFREATNDDARTTESRVNEMVAIGRTGTDSCSAVGPGGHTGCFVRQVEANRDERRAVNRSRQEEPR